MNHEIAELKRQAKFLNNPDTFAQCAKMERKALALEKHLERLQTQESAARAHTLIKIPGYIRKLSLVAIFILSYKVPVAVALRPEWVWPLGNWLAMGTGKPKIIGFVGIIPWTMICHRGTRALFGPRT
jgi:CHD5-like protein